MLMELEHSELGSDLSGDLKNEHLNNRLLSPVFRSSVILMPVSYYSPGKEIADEFSAVQTTIH